MKIVIIIVSLLKCPLAYSQTCTDVWKYWNGNSCTECPKGQVQKSGDVSKCELCPAGEVRGTGGTSDVPCSSGASTCPVWQYAKEGYCTECPRGEIQMSGDASKCELCPAGEVRGTGGTSDVPCSSGASTCPVWQYAKEGYCTECPRGEIQMTGDASQCELCPSGFVRGRSGLENIACLDGADVCYSFEITEGGFCSKRTKTCS